MVTLTCIAIISCSSTLVTFAASKRYRNIIYQVKEMDKSFLLVLYSIAHTKCSHEIFHIRLVLVINARKRGGRLERRNKLFTIFRIAQHVIYTHTCIM